MTTIAVLGMVTAFETSMLGFREYIPDEWQWTYPAVHSAVLVWLGYLRATTTQSLS